VVWPNLTADVDPTWVAEMEQIPAGDPAFTTLEAVPKKLAHRVELSNEIVDDSEPSVVDVLNGHLALMLGLKLDLSLFTGNPASNPDSIKGLKFVTGVQAVDMGTNGAALTNYDPFIKAAAKLRTANFPGPYAVFLHPRDLEALELLKDETGSQRQLQRPPDLPPFATTSQLPTERVEGHREQREQRLRRRPQEIGRQMTSGYASRRGFMAEISRPAGSAGEVFSRLDELRDFPFYGVLLYEPAAGPEGAVKGLDGTVRDYVVANWDALNAITGEHLALVVLDDLASLFAREAKAEMRPSPEARQFRPEDVYQAADLLGVDPAALPCLYLFNGSNPQGTTTTAVVVELRKLVPADAEVDEMHQFFRVLATACKTVNTEGKGKSPAKQLRKLLSELQSSGFPGKKVEIRDRAQTVTAVLNVVAALLGLKTAAP
jgi:Phage capsid family